MTLAFAHTPGAWQTLLQTAFELIDDAQARSGQPVPWALGGGTVLMLRHRHRLSNDIDLFVPDPQWLGWFNPRLGGRAEEIADRHDEGSQYVKLYLKHGEIDIVAATPLTSPGSESARLLGRNVQVETDVEIVCKKFWHRAHQAKARDLLDLCLVIDRQPDELRMAGRFFLEGREAFLKALESRRDVIKAQFEALDTLEYRPSFNDCHSKAEKFLMLL
jgi:Nucleotidyl transferase AbiEii toxin, Type IV TA system